MNLLFNSVAVWASQHLPLVCSLMGQRGIIPKVTGKARVTIALGQDITILIMAKLFVIDANNARKQDTVLIKGSIFVAQKASPAPCCQTVTIPSWQAQTDLLHPWCIAIPAPQHALPRLGIAWLIGAFTHTTLRKLPVLNSTSQIMEEKVLKSRIISTSLLLPAPINVGLTTQGMLQHMFTTTCWPNPSSSQTCGTIFPCDIMIRTKAKALIKSAMLLCCSGAESLRKSQEAVRMVVWAAETPSATTPLLVGRAKEALTVAAPNSSNYPVDIYSLTPA